MSKVDRRWREEKGEKSGERADWWRMEERKNERVEMRWKLGAIKRGPSSDPIIEQAASKWS